MDARATAARSLLCVLVERHSLDTALARHLPKLKDGVARALVQEMCYGVLRWHLRLEAASRRLLHSPLKDDAVHCLLLVGLYQLLYMRVAPHAAVDQTVAACQPLGKPWAKGLVNATLRSWLRDQVRLAAELDQSEISATAHPAWLIEEFKTDWPDQWRAIVAANNERPPLALRVNALLSTRAEYLDKLAAAGLAASAILQTSHGILLERPVPVEQLPGFSDGWVSVQDAAAQLAAPLLDLQPGQRVLDACAAPGGKTCHILESLAAQGGAAAEVVALDNDPARVVLIRQNLERLQLRATLITGDAASPADWWDGQPFDRILLDAPCSASGVIRRHPDIKVLRKAADIAVLAETQQKIVTALWPLLKAGGMLLYATCSVLARENEQQISRFLAATDDARAAKLRYPWRQAEPTETAGYQILPGEEGMDGFYYAGLRKN